MLQRGTFIMSLSTKMWPVCLGTLACTTAVITTTTWRAQMGT